MFTHSQLTLSHYKPCKKVDRQVPNGCLELCFGIYRDSNTQKHNKNNKNNKNSNITEQVRGRGKWRYHTQVHTPEEQIEEKTKEAQIADLP
jgi:hypothetical protein